MILNLRRPESGYTLVELMMTLASSMIVLAAVLTSGVALQRSFAAVEGYSIAQGDQLRVSDYIALDVRRATAASVDSVTGTLTLTIPNYYNAHNDAPTWTSASPVELISNGSGGYTYGTGTTLAGTFTIKYYKQGTTFVREVNGAPVTIADNVSTFTVNPQDLTSSVSCSITFSPTFNYLPGPGPVSGTTVYSNTFLRNAGARQ